MNWSVTLELEAQPSPKDSFDLVNADLALVEEVGIGPDRLPFSSAQHVWLTAAKQRGPQFEVQAILGLLPPTRQFDRRLR